MIRKVRFLLSAPRKWQFLYILAAFCVLIWSGNIYLGDELQQPTASAIEQQKIAALLKPYEGKPLALDSAQKRSDCHINGPLPDPACTPGTVFASATVAEICTQGYSESVRNVSVSLKKRLYAAYGFSYPQKSGAYELDHLIPLELGGSNDAANLFPEAAAPAPGFHEKDLVENYLHQEVCAGKLELPAAQKQIATNWLAVYNSLSPDTIAELKAEYRNWAN